MATTVGRIELELGADGRRFIVQVRELGRRAGEAGGSAAGRGFGKEFEKESGRNQRLIRSHVGRTIAAWTGLVLAIGQQTATLGSGVSAIIAGISGSLAIGLVGALGLAGTALSGFIAQAGLAINSMRFLREESEEVDSAMDKLASASEESGRRFAAAWGPSVGRLLETIAGLMSNTALIDAMAASLSSITDSFTAMLNSPGFTMFMDALVNVIPGALASLGAGFASLGSGLAAVFAGAAPVLATFASQFEAWAGTWSDTMTQMASDGRLTTFFELALQSMTAVFDLVGSLGNALITLFTAAAPYGNIMLGTITGLLDQWNAWMQSIEGQQALQTWFENGVIIFNALIELLGDVGTMFGNLVTPESVERLTSFITGLGDIMPLIGQILDFFGRLDILNIFVGLLGLIQSLLEPLMPILLELATVVGETLVQAMADLSPEFAKLGEALVPVMTLILELVVAILPPLIDIIISVIDYLAQFVEAFSPADTAVGDFASGAQVMGDIVGGVFQVLAAIIGVTLTTIGGFLRAGAALLRGDFSGAFKAMEDIVRGVFKALGLDFDAFVNGVTNLVNVGKRLFEDIGRAISRWGDGVGAVFDGIIGAVSGLIGWFNSLFGAANKAAGAASGASKSGGGGSGAFARPFASGGVLTGPRRILAGEAGAEAIVPLNRALSQVDPSVRWLSAIAQGLVPHMASGGTVGGGRTVIFEAGAIQVIGVNDPDRAAVAVMNRVAEKVGG
jgi:phage-related protein